MKKYDFDSLLNREGSFAAKWDMREQYYGDKEIMPFWVADMDFYCLPDLKKALVKRAQHDTYGYSFPSENYYQSFIDWNKKRNDYHVEKEEMIPIPGVVCATSFVIDALTQKGDKILLNTPVYNPFFDVIEQSDRICVRSSLILKNGRYTFDFEDMEEQLKQGGITLFILCNPHNPTGNVWTQEELEKVVALCDKYNVVIFSDEIHSDLVFSPHRHITIHAVNERAKEISVMSAAPSKTFNVAGIKSSILVIKDPSIREKVQKSITKFHVGVDLFGYIAFEVCYEKGEDWVDELLVYLKENAEFVVSYFEKNLPEIKTYVPEGTYLMWLDCRALGLSHEELVEKIKAEAKIALNSGVVYGKEGDGFMRLNIGTPRFYLEKGLDRFVKGLKQAIAK